MRIPIQNIYYLLCYAWNTLEERDVVNVAPAECKNIFDLLAKVLVSASTHLLKRGLDRNYVDHHEDRSALRGKVIFNPSLKRTLFQYGKAHCHYDDLHYDVLHNQILKSVIGQILTQKHIDSSLKDQLHALHRRLHGISEIEVTPKTFQAVQLHRNNAFYRFPLHVCELILQQNVVSEQKGGVSFREFSRDRRMWLLFQEFVRNFYRRELPGCEVLGRQLEWRGHGISDEARSALPKMNTDITLEYLDRTIIIDTKFYPKALTTYYGKEMVIPGHLFQLFAYLRNAATDEAPHSYEGILLYPTVGVDYDLKYVLHGHNISVQTVDLGKEWNVIHQKLIAAVAN